MSRFDRGLAIAKLSEQKSKINKVLKFGGSSIGSAERIKDVCKIVLENTRKAALLKLKKAPEGSKSDLPQIEQLAVVVSAMQGATDKLLALDFDWIREKHLTTAKELRVLPPRDLLNELENVIKGIKLLGDASPMALDLVASFGERLSARLIAAYFNLRSSQDLRGLAKTQKLSAAVVDSRELVKTDSNFQNANVDFAATNRNIKKFFSVFPRLPMSRILKKKSRSDFAGGERTSGVSKLRAIPIITGFIASTSDGKTTTLGRGGSDYTAAIFGAALNAEIIEIWTDVDGIMSADPRIVPEAFTLPRVSYEEAFEMAYFGAKVVYPPTMLPAIKKNIPVVIKNTFNPSRLGTIIQKRTLNIEHRTSNKFVKNISAIDSVSLINIGGTNLAGIPGTAARVFKAAAAAKINVIFISQASSEYTICFAVKKSDAQKTISALENEFEGEIRKGKVAVDKRDNQSIVAVVGENMRGVPGIAGRIFSVLGRNKINIFAIAQGSSERNVSFVIDRENKNEAINAIHREFFAGLNQPAIFLLGTGNVGGELLRQIANLELRTSNFGHLKVCGIANVDKMFFNERGINLKRWKRLLARSQDEMDLGKFLEKVRDFQADTKILVDCTASGLIAKKYDQFVTAGCHIVTPNKKANVLPISKYNALRKALARNKRTFHYQANVGAGLPVIISIKELVAAGDKIKKIEGIFSGTLSYLFNNYDPVRNRRNGSNKAGGKKFSELVKEARRLGYTEPDPREDLSGKDVGRKLLILAREMGWPLEFSDVKMENLADRDDNYFASRYKKACQKKCALRYVGVAQRGGLLAKLKEVPLDDPLVSAKGTDNIVAIYTKNYKNPLVIKGPGAGAEVTAQAVLSGILQICQMSEVRPPKH